MVCWDLVHSYKPGALYTTKHRVMYLFIFKFQQEKFLSKLSIIA